jgi:hypothetical protein
VRVTRWRAMPASRKNELLDRNAKTGGWDLMDGKLARGFTRDGFRREMKAAGATADSLSETMTKLAQKLRNRGKLSKDELYFRPIANSIFER